MARSPGRHPRRVNAPIRRAPAQGSIPDILLAGAVSGLTMAVVFVLASFFSEAIKTGEAGPQLARMFGGALAFTSLLIGLLGVLLMGERRQHFRLRVGYAFVLGGLVGVLMSVLFLELAGIWVLAPLALLLAAIRPLREWMMRGLGILPRRAGAR